MQGLRRWSSRPFSSSRSSSVNPGFERALGYRPEELVGRPFLDFVHPDDREKTEREAASLSDGVSTVQFQNRYFAKDGEVLWLEWTSIPLPDEGLIYGVARDVTERKARLSLPGEERAAKSASALL